MQSFIPALPKAYHKASVRALYAIGFIPAVWYFYLGTMNELGANPVKTFLQVLGLWALRFLLLSLVVTPLRDLANISWLRYRRALGLLAFYYVMMHFTVYLTLDRQMDVGSVVQDVLRRPFITLGMAALLCLIPLALTSNAWSITKLGPKWTKLHRLSYLIAALAAIHYYLSFKVTTLEIGFYLTMTALLLAYRLVRPRIMEARRQKRKASSVVR
jgi:methionine sulfoxide reductase heme-binding subunit